MLVVATLGLTAYLLIFNRRYQLLLSGVTGRPIGYAPLFELMVYSRFLNHTVPQSGNAYRGIRLKADAGITYTAYVRSSVFFAWLDTTINFLIAGIVILTLEPSIEIHGVPVLPAVCVVWLTVVCAPLLLTAVWAQFETLGVANRIPSKFLMQNQTVSQGIGNFLRSPRAVLAFFALSSALFVLMSSVFWSLFMSTGVIVSGADLALFYALYRLTILVTLTPGNLGVRELAYGLLAGGLGVGLVVGVVATLLLRILTTVVLACAFIWFRLVARNMPE